MLRTVARWLGRAATGLVATQLGTVAALVLLDERRKRRAGPARFPHSDRRTLTAAGGEVTVYTYGADLYEDMLAAIDAATARVRLETFIWKDDPVGVAFKEAVERAAARGVEVEVVFDTFANLVDDHRFYRFTPGVRVLAHPLLAGSPRFWQARHWGRDHRKLLVVDGEVAFVGGYNLGSLYATDWRDTHLRLIGPTVPLLENAFVSHWNALAGRMPRLASVPGPRWLPGVRLHENVPPARHFPIRDVYLAALARAEHRAWLTQAYLIPDDNLTEALVRAAGRGVDVAIVVPERSNHVVADWLSRGYYDRLLRGGVRILLYRHAMVHAKTAVIDDDWVTVGTANLDALSLAFNYEINLEFVDADVARVLAELFTVDETNCREMTLPEWRARGWYRRLGELVLWPLRRFF